MEERKDINKVEGTNELPRQSMKPINFVRMLYKELVNSDGSIRNYNQYKNDFKFLIERSGFKDSKDRVDFCVQLVYWLEHSDYITNTTKEFIKDSYGKGMKSFFEERQRRVARYNMYKAEDEMEIPQENVNTCISRVTSDIAKLHKVFDEEIYNSIFYEEDSSYWKVYKRNFLRQVEKSKYLKIDISEFGFEIPMDKITTTAPKNEEFREMLNVIALYSKKSKEKVLAQVNNSCWGYLLYLCSCIPQRSVDKENYRLLQKVLDGTYNEISKDMIEESSVVTKEKEIEELKRQLEENSKEINEIERQLEIQKELNEETIIKHNKQIIAKIREIASDQNNARNLTKEERLINLANYLDSNITSKKIEVSK